MNKKIVSERLTGNFPFQHWNGFSYRPFETDPQVANVHTGYKPIQYTEKIIETEEEECPMTFQTSCDITLPKNLCYRKYNEIISQP